MIFLQTVDLPEAVPPATPIRKGVLRDTFETPEKMEEDEELEDKCCPSILDIVNDDLVDHRVSDSGGCSVFTFFSLFQ
jgi:hypothetical protein